VSGTCRVILPFASLRSAIARRTGSFVVYGMALVGQYMTSFLYHSASGPAKPRLRNLDHCAIYLLIAGTYSPFTLVTLRGHWGWPLFAAIWFLAMVGILQEIRLSKRSRVLSLAIYLLMGWLWYLGTLLPVIGLIQVGSQSHADRYTYVPIVGLFLIAAWGAPELAARLRFGTRTLPALAAYMAFSHKTSTRREDSLPPYIIKECGSFGVRCAHRTP